jgi:hypothetical protein
LTFELPKAAVPLSVNHFRFALKLAVQAMLTAPGSGRRGDGLNEAASAA